jgi:hypothetical protein
MDREKARQRRITVSTKKRQRVADDCFRETTVNLRFSYFFVDYFWADCDHLIAFAKGFGMNAAQNVTPELAAKIERLDALLDSIAARHASVKLASSLAAKDMLLTHAILSRGVKIGIFSLNTGRLHAETLGMMDRVRERYGYEIEQFHPQAAAVDEYAATHGLNAFYESIDLRKRCCEFRKVEPLNRALADVGAWVTGQRREQSVTRAELHEEEHNAARNIAKYTACRLDGSRIAGVSGHVRCAGQSAACARLSEHRLRAVYPRDPSRRGQPGRALVVGVTRHEGMRAAHRHDLHCSQHGKHNCLIAERDID